jgi:hypothetical protein
MNLADFGETVKKQQTQTNNCLMNGLKSEVINCIYND